MRGRSYSTRSDKLLLTRTCAIDDLCRSGTTQDSSQDIDDGWDLEEFKRVVGPEFQEVLHRMTRYASSTGITANAELILLLLDRTIEQDKQQDTEPVPLPFNESDQSARTVAEYMSEWLHPAKVDIMRSRLISGHRTNDRVD